MFKFKATADATDPVVAATREDADNRRETVDLRPAEFKALRLAEHDNT